MAPFHLVEGECAEPGLRSLLEPYCFDDLPTDARSRFEEHALGCGRCGLDVERILEHTEVLQHDHGLVAAVVTHEDFGVFGLSGSLDRPFGGHSWFVLAASALFALLLAVPILVEVAYEFDRFGQLASTLAPAVFVVAMAGSLATFWVDTRVVTQGSGQFRWSLLTLAGWTLLLCALILPLLPQPPTVAANFQTYPVRLGYLKSVFYAMAVGPILAFWPFHFVLRMQRQLADGRSEQALALLERQKEALPPRGVPFIAVWVLACYVAGWAAFHYAGVAHLFDNLRPAPYMSLFMTLVLIRVATWMVLALVGLLWYANTLTELRREALAVRTLTRQAGGRTLPSN